VRTRRDRDLAQAVKARAVDLISTALRHLQEHRASTTVAPLASDRVVGLAEIADHLGAKRGTVYKWRARGLLPAPDMTISGQPAWWESTINAWAAETDRQAP
jgi:predicted DNA-binding transcriptional regulator AlpA